MDQVMNAVFGYTIFVVAVTIIRPISLIILSLLSVIRSEIPKRDPRIESFSEE